MHATLGTPHQGPHFLNMSWGLRDWSLIMGRGGGGLQNGILGGGGVKSGFTPTNKEGGMDKD